MYFFQADIKFADRDDVTAFGFANLGIDLFL
jgi:hypothetical protein